MDFFRSRMLLVFWLAPLIAQADSPPTHEFTLDNGLKVVVREDHRAPLVSSQLWFRVGSADEAPSRSGLSHALEHMVYKGSHKSCAGEAMEILGSLGAQYNAFTGKDFTVHHQTLEPRHLGVAFELMSDLMSTAHLRAEDWLPEIAVIQEERREGQDQPGELALERFLSLAHLSSGYRTPTIGWAHDLQRLDIADLRDWYQTRYAPGNAVLVVVGDVTLEQVKRLAQKYFGAVAARPFTMARAPLELDRPGERRLILNVPDASRQLLIAFNVPVLVTAEPPRTVHALRLLQTLLAGSSSARLQSQLQFKTSLFSTLSSQYNWLARGDGLLLIDGHISNAYTGSLDDAEARVWQEIEKLRTHPPAADELERARTQLIAQNIYGQDSIEGQSYYLGALVSNGLPWRSMNDEIADLKKVTPDDIRQAAATYLTRDRLAIAQVHREQTHE
ncbi:MULTISPECIES: M16 family metallopeptidase [Pseudomonas]|jgi:zinc protease|uniref:Peptidase M16 n=1 Tax=Pseudomonas frederiksbergensis TaxID=104087 RepID=A0A0B1Z6Z4_9PSED|nr:MULTISPECIES: pitrilysin family protein [Pseudomonas]KHK65113.1 peptidase M16 [Pseudomonas frederiksbergensis]MBI6617249.1 insulinase family protein [Pseudomonas corrugata]MBI6691801.1 insulinase family protein [Pseudomonas corrugata]